MSPYYLCSEKEGKLDFAATPFCVRVSLLRFLGVLVHTCKSSMGETIELEGDREHWLTFLKIGRGLRSTFISTGGSKAPLKHRFQLLIV
jgi:hypothetical protein